MTTVVWREELAALLGLALPSALSSFCFSAFSLLELSVMGHLGVDELAAVAFSQMSMDLSTLILMQGLNAGLNALCSQAFGAKSYQLLGEYAQLTACLVTLMCVPLAVLWWHLGDLLAAMGVADTVAVYARIYSRLAILGMWPEQVFQVLAIYFQSQQLVWPTAQVNVLGVFLSVVLAVGLTFGLGGFPRLGFMGCAIGAALARWLRLGLYFYFMVLHKRYHRRCPWRWSPRVLRRWRKKGLVQELVAVGVPLALGNLAENAQLQVMALYSAQLGRVALGTHNAMMALFFVLTSPMHGLMDAAVTCLGNRLGAGRADRARVVARLTALTIGAVGVFNGAVTAVAKDQVGRIFSDDPTVIESFREVVSLGAVTYLIVSVFAYAMTILEAQARTTPILVAFVVGAWVVGVPAAYYLGLVRRQRSLLGVWLGMIAGYVVTSAISLYAATCQNDWEREARAAVARSTSSTGSTDSSAESAPLLVK